MICAFLGKKISSTLEKESAFEIVLSRRPLLPCQQRRHADINLKSLLSRQPAQALPDLRKTRLVLLYAQRGAYLDMYARERWGAKD